MQSNGHFCAAGAFLVFFPKEYSLADFHGISGFDVFI
jgi:hypothetical protein